MGHDITLLFHLVRFNTHCVELVRQMYLLVTTR